MLTGSSPAQSEVEINFKKCCPRVEAGPGEQFSAAPSRDQCSPAIKNGLKQLQKSEKKKDTPEENLER
jgi:hypothetical protein